LVTNAFRQSYFTNTERGCQIGLASARAENVIGGGDLTPYRSFTTVAAFAKDQPVVLRNPDATRPWQHVLDCLNGYLTLAEALYREPEEFSGSWNFGPTDADTKLGWQGRFALETSLEWTSDWFRRYATGQAARNLCLSQIGDYMAIGPRHPKLRAGIQPASLRGNSCLFPDFAVRLASRRHNSVEHMHANNSGRIPRNILACLRTLRSSMRFNHI
jgi:CDP-glucose 4,6-dehydratase